jgi:hypothetical protein
VVWVLHARFNQTILFLLPLRKGKKNKLGVPICFKKRLNRQNGMPYKLAIKKMINGLLSESCSTMVLPVEPKMGLGGCNTPVYTLNHIIRLQAVFKIITNETARTLNLLAKQSTKMLNPINQNYLGLNYLLASEGGVCEKFNLNCCLQINDKRFFF